MPILEKTPAAARTLTDYPWRHLFLSMTCGILVADTQGKLLFANPPAGKILEIDPSGGEGRSLAVVLRRHPTLRQVLNEAPGLHTLPNRVETEIRSSRGRKKTIGFTATVLRSDTGVPIGSALFFKDLTQIEKREERDRLRDRLAALGQMAAGMAHEIRNPLAAIQVTTTLLCRNLNEDGESIRLLEKIQREVRRLDHTLVECLDYVRPLVPTFKMGSLLEVVEESIQDVRPEFPDSEVRISLGFEPSLPPLRMDRAMLRQVFQNILRNALEAMGREGNLLVSASIDTDGTDPNRPNPSSRGDRYLKVTFHDDGPGIPAEIHEKLFYPFFTTKKSGSGLGLAVARKIVEIHGGLVDLETEPGRGTSFIFLFPLTGEPLKTTPRSSTKDRSGGKRGDS